MKKGLIFFSLGIFTAIVVAAIFGFFAVRNAQEVAAQTTAEEESLASIEQSKFVELAKPKVLGVSDEKSVAAAASENYQIKEISFGGDMALANGENNDNLDVKDVHSELLMTKDQKDYRFLISWRTNKLALSEITYSKAGASPKTLRENGYGLSHSVVLTGLEAGSAYSYVIKTTDKWGNLMTSDKYAMYTSSRALSVFDLITKEFSGMFGWAMK